MTWLLTKKTLWISGILFLVSQTILFFILKDVDSSWNLFRHQTTFSPETFEAFVSAWGPEKTAQFLRHYYLDCIHPLLFATFFASCLARSRYSAGFVLIPYIAALADEIENLVQSQIIMGNIPLSSSLFCVGAMASNLKWLILTICLWAIVLRLIPKRK